MTTEKRSEATLEEQPVTEQPQAEAKKKPKRNQVTIALSTEVMEKLRGLAELWGESPYATAKKLLTGQIQHHYSINKLRGRL